MEFAQERAGDVLIIRMAGRLDSSTAQPAEDSFSRVIGDSPPRLAVDLSKLEYISSAGLRVLLVVAKKVQQAKGKVVLFGLLPNVREVFSISGFDQIFSIEPDAATAVAAVR
jgi:anti-anti-sigma factor